VRDLGPSVRIEARHAALAADHAALIDAFTRLGEASGQARWITHAIDVADMTLDHFWDHDHGGVFTTADDGEALIVRHKDLFDQATPSANSTLAIALYRLSALTDEQRFANHADRIVQLLATPAAQNPAAFGNAMAAIDLRITGTTEIVITGDRPDLVATARRILLPNAVFAWGERYDSPLWADRPDGFAYVCRNFTCSHPASTPQAMIEAIIGRPLDATNPQSGSGPASHDDPTPEN
ncbi:MAG TPA: hypothetical protein PLV68_17150, partial [Ilumatobacteraceae bacterium]|nr:hypothetical protein [Ilumatobacteraceae bacterium]